jgi:hypothetical protein
MKKNNAFFKGIRWLPLVLIYSILIYTYYVYTVVFCAHYLVIIKQKVKSTLYQTFFQIFFMLTMFDFTRCVIKDPGRTKKTELYFNGEMGPHTKHSILLEGEVDFCKHCQLRKPSRSSHCNICGSCVFKHSLHSYFMNNCIGFGNEKFFFLLSFWSSLLSVFVFATLLQILIWQLGRRHQSPNAVQMLIVCCISLVFIFICIPLFCFNLMLLLRGRTWREYREGGSKSYDLGWKKNIVSVLGPKWYLWLVPYFNSQGDGVNYPQS